MIGDLVDRRRVSLVITSITGLPDPDSKIEIYFSVGIFLSASLSTDITMSLKATFRN